MGSRLVRHLNERERSYSDDLIVNGPSVGNGASLAGRAVSRGSKKGPLEHQ